MSNSHDSGETAAARGPTPEAEPDTRHTASSRQPGDARAVAEAAARGVETGAETLAPGGVWRAFPGHRACAPGGVAWELQAAYNRMVSLMLDGVQGRVEDD